MDKKFKEHLFLVAFGIILFSVLTNLKAVFSVLDKGLDIIFPVLVGFLIAFVLNVPLKGIEQLFQRITKNKAKNQLLDLLVSY